MLYPRVLNFFVKEGYYLQKMDFIIQEYDSHVRWMHKIPVREYSSFVKEYPSSTKISQVPEDLAYWWYHTLNLSSSNNILHRFLIVIIYVNNIYFVNWCSFHEPHYRSNLNWSNSFRTWLNSRCLIILTWNYVKYS